MRIKPTKHEDLCVTLALGSDIPTVAEAIGAVPAVREVSDPNEIYGDDRLTIITAWGQGVAVVQPSMSAYAAQPQVLAALSINSRTAIAVSWSYFISLGQWGNGSAVLAYAEDSRLRVAIDPADFDAAGSSTRLGWEPTALDETLTSLSWGIETVAVPKPVGARRGRGVSGHMTHATWQDSCISLLESFADAPLLDSSMWSEDLDQMYLIQEPLQPLTETALDSFFGPATQ